MIETIRGIVGGVVIITLVNRDAQHVVVVIAFFVAIVDITAAGFRAYDRWKNK